MAQQKSVILVISHLPDPQYDQRYEEQLDKVMPIAVEFPGHLGVNVIQPAAGQNLRSIITRLDILEHLYARTRSEIHRQLVAEIVPLLTEGDRTEVRTESTFWPTPPTANVCQSRRWKQFLIILLVTSPSANLMPTVTGMLLPSLKGSLLLHLINDACVVALVVWFWMSIVIRLFAGWLKKD